MLPNFVIIGAMKSGTNSLYRYLRWHPEIFLSTPKEPCFFVREMNWSKGRAWYEGLFQDAGNAVAIGEASTTYSMHPLYRGVPERIADLLPNVRLVYLVRDPIDRMRSHYLQNRNPGTRGDDLYLKRERLPIDRALLENPVYLDCSRYAYQVEQFLRHFPQDRMLVLTSESLRTERGRAVRRAFEFLGVDPDWVSPVLDQEFHRTEQRLAPRPAARTLRRISAYRALARLAPTPLRNLNRRLSNRRIDASEGEITEELRSRLQESLRGDVSRLRSYMREAFDGWGIA